MGACVKQERVGGGTGEETREERPEDGRDLAMDGRYRDGKPRDGFRATATATFRIGGNGMREVSRGGRWVAGEGFEPS